MKKIKRYTEAERKSVVRYGVTSLRFISDSMPFDALLFWVGLGLLLTRGYELKATHDALTAFPPDGAKRLERWDRAALIGCGWHKKRDGSEGPDEAYPWVSFYPGG